MSNWDIHPDTPLDELWISETAIERDPETNGARDH